MTHVQAEGSLEPELSADRRLARNFDRVAERYDFLNRLNPGYQKHLRWSARRLKLSPVFPRAPEGTPRRAQVLDLCCGTGLSTQALVEAYPDAVITALDMSAGMLAAARRKPELAAVRFLLGDAMEPAAAGATGPYDGILMAYGIRNVLDRDLCLARLRPLLRPGGRIAFHEYSVADSRLSQTLWNVVASALIIPLGTLFTEAPEIFRYLRRSVNEFDGTRAFCARLERAGFVDVQVLPMDGWQRGVTHTFVATAATRADGASAA